MSQPRSLQGKQGNRTYFCTLCVFSLADVVLEKQLITNTENGGRERRKELEISKKLTVNELLRRHWPFPL